MRSSTASRAETSAQTALLYLDLDRFKAVNDSLGHHAGDELLKAVAHRLSLTLREGDVLSRLMFGGGTLLWGAAEATAVAFLLGVPAGLLAGYSGGAWDRLLSWLADLSFAIVVHVGEVERARVNHPISF